MLTEQDMVTLYWTLLSMMCSHSTTETMTHTEEEICVTSDKGERALNVKQLTA
jgi:hypothetical protein